MAGMNRLLRSVGAVGGAAAMVAVQQSTQLHCQVPCGIFDDPLRTSVLREDAATCRKAMLQVQSLAATCNNPQALNQATRWVNVKEQSAANIITLVSEYMLCQRVKKDSFASHEEYVQALELHHTLMQAAMKVKQSVDTKACDNLDHAVEDVCKMYSK